MHSLWAFWRLSCSLDSGCLTRADLSNWLRSTWNTWSSEATRSLSKRSSLACSITTSYLIPCTGNAELIAIKPWLLSSLPPSQCCTIFSRNIRDQPFCLKWCWDCSTLWMPCVSLSVSSCRAGFSMRLPWPLSCTTLRAIWRARSTCAHSGIKNFS